jgi:hypothetical protein
MNKAPHGGKFFEIMVASGLPRSGPSTEQTAARLLTRVCHLQWRVALVPVRAYVAVAPPRAVYDRDVQQIYTFWGVE